MEIEQAIKKAGSVMSLARILGVKRQAVQQYRQRGMPQSRITQLRKLRPEWFRTAKS